MCSLALSPLPITDITNDDDLNIVGNVGIEGTPVIDPESNAIFVVACTRESGGYVQRIHKLDVRDGKDLLPATVIEASVPSTARDAFGGDLRFDPKAGNQRPALALVGGAVIIAWASHEDIRHYHGWVMAYELDDAAPARGVVCHEANAFRSTSTTGMCFRTGCSV